MTSRWMIALLLIQNLGVMVACLCEKNYLKALYWFGASCINSAVLMLK